MQVVGESLPVGVSIMMYSLLHNMFLAMFFNNGVCELQS